MSTSVVITQFIVVETKQVEPGDMDISDMMYAFHSLGTNLVGCNLILGVVVWKPQSNSVEPKAQRGPHNKQQPRLRTTQ